MTEWDSGTLAPVWITRQSSRITQEVKLYEQEKTGALTFQNFPKTQSESLAL